MRDDVRVAALKHAAKVAFGTLLGAGCAAEPAKPPTATMAAQDPASCHTQPPVALPVQVSPSLQAPQRTCEQVFATIPDQAFSIPEPALPELAGCCRGFLDHAAAEWAAGRGSGWGTLVALCCRFEDSPSGMVQRLCSPWGPPVPPAMPTIV